MLTITDRRFGNSPSALGRRDFLRIGSLCGLTMPGLRAAQSQDALDKDVFKNKSVVFLFLQGGPPQIETFDPKIDVAADNRSCTGKFGRSCRGFGSAAHCPSWLSAPTGWPWCVPSPPMTGATTRSRS